MGDYFEEVFVDRDAIKEELEHDLASTCDVWKQEMQPDCDEVNNKCGEVIFQNNQTFILVCSLCGKNFEDLSTFGDHILYTHLKSEVEENYDQFESFFVNEIKLEEIAYSNESMDIPDESCSAPESNEHTTDEPIKNSQEAEETRTVVPERREDRAEYFLQELEDNTFMCKICNSQYCHKRTYYAHAKRKHGLLTKKMKHKTKPRVKKEESAARKLEDMLILSEKGKFTCTVCETSYKHKKSIQLHIRTTHGSQPKKKSPTYWKCKFCGERFQGKEDHKKHMNENHIGETKFPCPHCERGFRTKDGCRIHIYTHTGEKPLSCPHCPKKFTVSSNLQKHIDAHLNIKKYPCQFCDKWFVQSSERTTHEKRHTGEKPFQCEQCGKRFIEHALLSRHRLRHLDIRSFKCEICDKAFFEHSMLNKHMAVHNSQRPFKCKTCGESFSRRNSLRQHEQLHSAVKRYVCKVCGKAFSQAAGLYSHKKSHGEALN